MIPDDLIDEELIVRLAKTKKRIDIARDIAEDQIDIDNPWNYDPDDYDINQDAYKPAITWVVESRNKLENAQDDDLNKLAERIEEAEKAFIEEFGSDSDKHYKSLFLIISTQDGLITWLCDNDPNRTGYDPNDIGEEVFPTGEKEKAVKKWYDDHSPMNIEGGDGEIIKDKWSKFFNHRHRIMHGHPNAYFDDNLALTGLFFLGLIGYTTGSRYEELQSSGRL
jgi:hypothetical protein